VIDARAVASLDKGVMAETIGSKEKKAGDCSPALIYWKKSPAAIFSRPYAVAGGKKRGFCRLPWRVATPGAGDFFETLRGRRRQKAWFLPPARRVATPGAAIFSRPYAVAA
jgi:hypothetical protein